LRAQEQICSSKLPDNIDAGQLAPKMIDILSRSETFRRQCLRIAATRVLRIRLGIELQPLNSASYRALTELERYEAGALRADVRLVFGENYVEILGHEFEHVLEQIDGVNLRSEVSTGGARVLPGGAYETHRATEAGLQVLREYQTLPSRLRPAAFGWRCMPPGGVAPPSHTPAMLGQGAAAAGRISSLSATHEF
jgi:hypothetical protein